MYSRISAHINGDWNACGKVMGLAPWAGRTMQDAEDGWYFPAAASKAKKDGLKMSRKEKKPLSNFMTGAILSTLGSLCWC